MAFRFQRRITLAPRLRLNLSKRGLGLSVGPRGASLSVGPRGVHGHAGIPATGLVFSSRHYTGTVKAYGLTQEFTTPYTPEQNGLVERFFRSLKEECIWLHRFESLGQARVVIDRWIRYYNEERPHQSLDYLAPRAHPALAA